MVLDGFLQSYISMLVGVCVGWHTDSPTPMRCNGGPKDVDGFQYVIRSLNFSQLLLKGQFMNSIIYLVGAVVIILAVLSFFGLR
jgi:hypothetical protein